MPYLLTVPCAAVARGFWESHGCEQASSPYLQRGVPFKQEGDLIIVHFLFATDLWLKIECWNRIWCKIMILVQRHLLGQRRTLLLSPCTSWAETSCLHRRGASRNIFAALLVIFYLRLNSPGFRSRVRVVRLPGQLLSLTVELGQCCHGSPVWKKLFLVTWPGFTTSSSKVPPTICFDEWIFSLQSGR